MTAIWILLAALAVLLLAFLTATYAIYRMTFWNDHKNDDLSRRVMEGEQYDPYHDFMAQTIETALRIPVTEEVRIPAYDGGELFAKLYLIRQDAPVCILFHGYKGEGIRDFSGGLKMIVDMGYNAILVDERGHRRSRGRTITFGIRERRDVASWVAYAADRFGKDRPIFLSGISMGAATVLMASDQHLPGNVRGILADCPYAIPEEIILHTTKNTGFPVKGIRPLLRASAFLWAHIDLNETDAIRAVSRSNYPILIIHGGDDRFVPEEMSARIADANPRMVRRKIVPGAAHGIAYVLDPEQYRNWMAEFFRENLPDNQMRGEPEA